MAFTALSSLYYHSDNLVAVLAVFAYCTTLYPGFSRDLYRPGTIKALGKYRQEIGIASCLLSCIHAGLAIHLSLLHNPPENFWAAIDAYKTGLIGLAIFLALGFTSNRYAQKKMKKGWKRLHSLTYILPLLLIWHIVAKMTDWSMLTQICFLLLVSAMSLLILRLSKRLFPQLVGLK